MPSVVPVLKSAEAASKRRLRADALAGKCAVVQVVEGPFAEDAWRRKRDSQVLGLLVILRVAIAITFKEDHDINTTIVIELFIEVVITSVGFVLFNRND